MMKLNGEIIQAVLINLRVDFECQCIPGFSEDIEQMVYNSTQNVLRDGPLPLYSFDSGRFVFGAHIRSNIPNYIGEPEGIVGWIVGIDRSCASILIFDENKLKGIYKYHVQLSYNVEHDGDTSTDPIIADRHFWLVPDDEEPEFIDNDDDIIPSDCCPDLPSDKDCEACGVNPKRNFGYCVEEGREHKSFMHMRNANTVADYEWYIDDFYPITEYKHKYTVYTTPDGVKVFRMALIKKA